MEQLKCKNCQENYSEQRPPRLLPMCGHSLCQHCLRTRIQQTQDGIFHISCFEDSQSMQVNDKKQLCQFPINKGLLQLIKKENLHFSLQESNILKNDIDEYSGDFMSALQVFDKSKSTLKSDQQICSIHNQKIKNVCIEHQKKICSDCALFGDHKGHDVMKIKDVINQVTLKAQQVLIISNQITYNFNQQCQTKKFGTKLLYQMSKTFSCKKEKLASLIKQRFNKIVQSIKKQQKKACQKLQKIFTLSQQMAKQKLLPTQQINNKAIQWKTKALDMAHSVSESHDVQQLLKYIIQGRDDDILKNGAHIITQIQRYHDQIINSIDKQANYISSMIPQYCCISKLDQLKLPLTSKRKFIKQNKNSKQNKIQNRIQTKIGTSSPGNRSSRSKKQLITFKPQPFTSSEQDLLIDGQQAIHQTKEQFKTDFIPLKQLIKQSVYKQPQVMIRTKSPKQKQFLDNSILATSVKLRKKTIKVPQKYQSTLEDIKNGKSELIDFTNAQLGQQTVLNILQLIRGNCKIKAIKFIRNKLTDQIIVPLIRIIQTTEIQSINLSQNQLTERSLEILLDSQMKGRLITLSLNKINQRSAKPKIQRLKKAGINVTL